MGKTEKQRKRYGLLGKNIDYSFSRGYFNQKFQDLGLLDHTYENFDIAEITEVSEVFKLEGLQGLNVTIPYKQEVIEYLDVLDSDAAAIGAVNTIKPTSNGLKGFNTDAYGFETSLKPFLKPFHDRALILGTGGASKAICFVLDKLNIPFSYVSRKKKKGQFIYEDLDSEIIKNHPLIINCTPLGTFPNIQDKPPIPYSNLGENHLLFDLIYNPSKTTFLALGEQKGATITNGHAMLVAQAEKAWEIWNTPE